jgi:hypothetical protein
MPVAADAIRRLTRAYIGARVYQGLLFCLVLVHNITAGVTDLGYRDPRLFMWLTLGAIVAAGTLGTYYQWRFGRVEPPRRSVRQQVVRGTMFALFLLVIFPAVVLVAEATAARPRDLIWWLLSTGTAASLATSRGDRLGRMVPLLASLALLATLVVPAMQPFRALGHAGMAAALIVTAVQLHLFVVRGFRHAHV